MKGNPGTSKQLERSRWEEELQAGLECISKRSGSRAMADLGTDHLEPRTACGILDYVNELVYHVQIRSPRRAFPPNELLAIAAILRQDLMARVKTQTPWTTPSLPVSLRRQNRLYLLSASFRDAFFVECEGE